MQSQESKYLQREVSLLKQLLAKEELIEQYDIEAQHQAHLQQRIAALEKQCSNLQDELTHERAERIRCEEERKRSYHVYRQRYFESDVLQLGARLDLLVGLFFFGKQYP